MIDDILALYINDVSERVIVNFYKLVCVFVEMLRNCLNEMGWDKLSNYKRIEVSGADIGTFTEVKNANCIPEFLNDFILVYLPKKCNLINR